MGALVGKRTASYRDVPVIENVEGPLGSDDHKHLGAAMASYGSVPLYHLVGITLEVPELTSVCNPDNLAVDAVTEQDFAEYFGTYGNQGDKVDVVVFSAPQRSLLEMAELASMLDGKTVHQDTALFAVTSPVVAADARRPGISARIEAAGGRVLQGM